MDSCMILKFGLSIESMWMSPPPLGARGELEMTTVESDLIIEKDDKAGFVRWNLIFADYVQRVNKMKDVYRFGEYINGFVKRGGVN